MPSRIDAPEDPAAPVLSAQTLALCLLMCSALQIMENLLPRIPVFPWLKLGLSYLVLLPFLLRFGATAAVMLLLGRNFLTLVFAGQALTSFLIGTLSGVATLWLGGYVVRQAYRWRLLGLIGSGMSLAAMMNLSQLALVESLFIHHRAFYFQLAPLLAWSVVSGAMVAFLAHRLQPVLEDLFREPENRNPIRPDAGEELASGSVPFFFMILALLTGLFLIQGLVWQGATLAMLLVFPQRGRDGVNRMKAVSGGLFLLIKAWPFFAYLAWLHLFLGEGEFVIKDWITREGARDFLFYSTRLANLLLLGPWLATTFPRQWLKKSSSVYARGLLACLPLLPGLQGASMAAGRAFFLALRRRKEADVLSEMSEGFRSALSPAKNGSG